MSDASPAEPILYLKPRRAKPFFLRHPWVFSGAIGRVDGRPAKGQTVIVADADGRFIGRGFYNADSQIVVRLCAWDPDVPLDDALIRARIEAALRLRRDVLRLEGATNAYRVVYSDSDSLPGLIVDRYGPYLVVQFLTAGIAQRRETVLNVLEALLAPAGILERSDDDACEREGMPASNGVLRGAVPAGEIEIACDGMRILVSLAGGQKTGFFLDQRENRLAAARYLKGRSVLDAFCYTGSFGIAAMRLGGASSLLGLDRSEPAVTMARRNYEQNGLAKAEARVADISTELRELRKFGRRFGAVILDPPKFARNRPGVERALRGYRDLNLMAMQLLEPDGILVTCSCSGHVSEMDFLMMLNDAAVEAGVALQLLERRGQAADHPVIASCPETAYLKCFIGRINSV